ncbi:MAG: polymerase III, beta subunit protein [Candidatus Moranbacteria bacterium GW2011_GWE1_49_15]|nr:MAG: polymerase III, beta subunit protein [Candidatus Moranbacteria bacterium GW2011_GWE1_49_15]HBP00822.1 DNA polymerase III subunit beta [Candidatus Moranbacteria bacterium]
MKVICTQENFKKAIYNTERVVGKHITLPILENILLETEGGMLKISATNLEIGVFLKVGAKVEKEGKITIPAKLLSSFVNNLPADSTVSLVLEDQALKVSSGSVEATVKGLLAQDFPIIPEMEGSFLFSLPAQEIKEMIPRLISCASLDNTRPELSGVNMLLFENEVHLAATDSFRLAEAVVPIKKENENEYRLFKEKNNSLIIPSNTLSEVLRVISPETKEIKVSIEESQIFFQIDNVRIVSRLINGKYPEYKQIIPGQFSTKVVLLKDELLRAVKIAGIFARNKAGEVKFEIDPTTSEARVYSKAEEVGENKTILQSEISGPEQEVIFNPRFIADAVQAISTPKVALLMNSSSSPAVLRMVEGKENKEIKNYTHIIMPIKS